MVREGSGVGRWVVARGVVVGVIKSVVGVGVFALEVMEEVGVEVTPGPKREEKYSLAHVARCLSVWAASFGFLALHWFFHRRLSRGALHVQGTCLSVRSSLSEE